MLEAVLIPLGCIAGAVVFWWFAGTSARRDPPSRPMPARFGDMTEEELKDSGWHHR